MPLQPVPEVDEILSTAEAVALPMRTRFRGQTVREAVIFQGPAGWAEFAPFSEYGPDESAQWLASGIQAAFQGLGAPLRTAVPVNATIPAVSPSRVEAVLARYGEAVPAVKIKVAEPGQSRQDDVDRVAEVRRLLPRAALRVDANGGWSIPEAVAALGDITQAAGGLEYAEQPVAGVEPLARLREQLATAGLEVPIAADEAVRKAEDPLRVAQLGAANLIVVKAPPLGGVDRALDLVRQAGLPAVVSSALDTSVGLTAGLALAARLPQLPFACGLGTVTLFDGELVDEPLVPVSGTLDVPTQSGQICAPAPVPELMQRHRITGPRRRWWFDRVRAAHQVLAS
ncbi:o-succinylbenzoate synthase [Nesterenkonia sp.]|uniref:o-succinylbenzoate synthase n=1 Tax=Nesterenkonia sp. TaxID=704201 RepID=UPI003454B780